MEKLACGYEIKTLSGGVAAVKSYLSSDGGSDFYTVDVNGEEKVLKWYKNGALGKSGEALYENLKNNVKVGAPSQDFLWPQDLTETDNGSFGCISDARSKDYCELTDILLGRALFKNSKAAVDACITIASAFAALHSKGLCFSDVYEWNFYVNASNGKVLVCESENVTPVGTDRCDCIKNRRYIAPEIVLGKKSPDVTTDLHTLAVLIFVVLCKGHPLEGRKYLVPCLSYELQKKLYGSEASFIMDPENKENEAVSRIYGRTVAIWENLPDHVKEIFKKAFSSQALCGAEDRPTELDWIRALTRLRSEIVACPTCQQNGRSSDVFVKDAKSCKCNKCGSAANIPFRLELKDYSLPAVADTRIYRAQVDACSAADGVKPFARIAYNDPTRPTSLSIKNLAESTWNAVTPSGKDKTVSPKEFIPLIDGIKFVIGETEIYIKAN